MSSDLSRKTWLERHPKKIIFLIVFLVVCGLALVTEKILALKAGNLRHPQGVKRYIDLREFPPGYSDILLPPKEALTVSDTLVRRDYLIRVDDDGFIMPSKVHEHPDLVLAFLGGSTTECIYDDENNRFPYLAGHLLEEKTGLKVNSYNAAKSGNDSLHSINVLLNKVVPLKPDIAVTMENINDLAVLLYEGTYWNKHPTRSPLVVKKPTWKTVGKNLEETFRLARDLVIPNLYSVIYQLVHVESKFKKDEFKQVRGRKIEVHPDQLVPEFTLNLQTFINICRARGITPVLMTMPSRLKDDPDALIARLMKGLEVQQGITYREFKGAFDRFNQVIREVGARNQLLVVDLAREIPQEKEYMSDVAHYTPAGSRLVAQKIAAALRPVVSSLNKRPSAN
ncbi:MAG: SGNH/GDSL hydrolase family protein [Deltaproteobacteria bacterium]|nr:SGNH/GDSL hydrolase family protein [Deltaproteobacteria bacterium]